MVKSKLFLGLGLGVDFTFTWDNKNKNNHNNNAKNPHLISWNITAKLAVTLRLS